MKISKLFHWLYATLMFLPLVFFIPSCLYYSFNEHATNTETTTINYKYESNEVNSINDLVVGNIYQFNTNGTSIWGLCPNANDEVFFQLLSDLSINNSNMDMDDYTASFIKFTPNTYLRFQNSNDEYTTIALYEYEQQYFDANYVISFLFEDNFLSNCIVRLIDFNYNGNQTPITFEYTDYNVIESVSVNTDDTITDKLNRSWNAIFDLPMFSWTKTTFVSGAFVYISGLFGVQTNNPLNYLFAYFVSISICWLVFDVLLYVPNLAHRWLDKGAIE